MLKKTDPTKTILTITAGFILIFLVKHWNWALKVSVIVALIGIFSDYLSDKINWIWMKLAEVLSKIVPNILLSIIFFFFIFPLSVLARLFKKENMLMIRDPKSSTFVEHKKEFAPNSFEHPW